MININLLSPEQKKELKVKRVYVAVKELVMLFLLFASIIAILLLVSRYVLEQQLAGLISRNASSIQISQATSGRVASINQKINSVEKIQKKFRRWSDLFVQISQLTPDHVSYNLLKIYQQEATLEMQGVAQNRQDLLKLQKQLEASGLFSEIDLPLNNLLAKENNAFNIRAKIKTDPLP